MAPVLVDELVYEELEADHGHEAEPDHEADPHHDPQLQGGAHRLLALEWDMCRYVSQQSGYLHYLVFWAAPW